MNVDVRLLPCSFTFSANTGTYLAILAASRPSPRAGSTPPPSWPKTLPPLNGQPGYVHSTASSAASGDPRWTVFDAVAAYYAANRPDLLAAAAQRAAAPATPPPVPPLQWPRPQLLKVQNGAPPNK